MQVLDVAILSEQVVQVLLRRFLVDVSREDDPAFDAADGDGVGGGARIAAGRGLFRNLGGGGAVLWRVELHFVGGHDCCGCVREWMGQTEVDEKRDGQPRPLREKAHSCGTMDMIGARKCRVAS